MQGISSAFTRARAPFGAGGLIYSNQFIQFSTSLPSPTLYGLGEHVAPLPLDVNWSTLPLWARDQGTPTGYTNLYASHPFYLAMEPDGNAVGSVLINANAMDVILQPTPALTYRTIGGVIDAYVFIGPAGPDSVIAAYTGIIGKPRMPVYWSLGFHLCRWGYGSLNATEAVVAALASYGIPQDTQWNDIDYMRSYLDFTYDPVAYAGLPDFVARLHADGMHYTMITDPGISNTQPPGSYPPFDEGTASGVWINNSAGAPWVGGVWPGATVFADFWGPSAYAWWRDQIATFHGVVPFDGLWIDMNEVSVITQEVQCGTGPLVAPPYM